MLSSLGAMGLGALVVVFGLVVGAAAAPCNPTATLEYVAMGDSYSSGVGLPDATGECNRSTGYNYPNRIQQDQGFGSFTDVSCSGAKTEHFSTAKNDSSPPQFDALSDTTDVVTFTIGGNDLGFTSILAICALMDDCRDAYGGPGMPKLTAKIAGSVGDSIQQAMEDSAGHAPNADIFVLGYPDLLPATPTGSTWEQSCEPTSLFISDAERNDLRQVQAALNAEIELRVDAAGARVHYVDTYTPSIGHDACSSDPWVSVYTLYHLTDTAMIAMGGLVSEAIDAELTERCEAAVATTSTTTTAPPSTTLPPGTAPPGTADTGPEVPKATTTPSLPGPGSAPVQTPPPSLVPQKTSTRPTVTGAVVVRPTATPTPPPVPIVVAEPVAAANTQGAVGQSYPGGASGGLDQSTLGQSGQPGQPGRSGLASTGAEPRGFLIVGAVLFGVGAGLVVLNRRRLARFGGRGDRR